MTVYDASTAYAYLLSDPTATGNHRLASHFSSSIPHIPSSSCPHASLSFSTILSLSFSTSQAPRLPISPGLNVNNRCEGTRRSCYRPRRSVAFSECFSFLVCVLVSFAPLPLNALHCEAVVFGDAVFFEAVFVLRLWRSAGHLVRCKGESSETSCAQA